MSSKRIKLFIYIDSLRIGGMHRQMLYLAKHLNKDDFEVLICTQHLTGGFLSEFEQTGCKLFDLGWRRKLDLSIILRLVNVLEIESPDIIFITEAQNLFYYRLARLFWHRKVVQIGSFRAMTFWKGHLKKYYQPLDNFFSRWLLRSSDYVVVNSIAMKNHYSRFIKQKTGSSIEVIYNGSDFSFPITRSATEIRQELNLSESDFVIIMVARLDPWKDFITLLDAAKIVVNSDTRAKFLLVGDGELKNALEQTILHMNLQDNVLLTGEKKDVFNYINAAEVSVLSTFGEGFSNSLMESMALGKPVVATYVGGNPEVLGKAGILVSPKSPELFADAILGLMRDEVVRNDIGKLAKERVLQLCGVEKYISSFESLCFKSLHKEMDKHSQIAV